MTITCFTLLGHAPQQGASLGGFISTLGGHSRCTRFNRNLYKKKRKRVTLAARRKMSMKRSRQSPISIWRSKSAANGYGCTAIPNRIGKRLRGLAFAGRRKKCAGISVQKPIDLADIHFGHGKKFKRNTAARLSKRKPDIPLSSSVPAHLIYRKAWPEMIQVARDQVCCIPVGEMSPLGDISRAGFFDL